MSLTYQDPEQSPGGKTSEGTDTFEGRFLELIPDEKIVEVIEFESQDPRFAGGDEDDDDLRRCRRWN
jgi:hypothetical protein